jgi:hypothetical protein
MTRDIKTPLPPAASTPTASAKRYLAQLMEYAFREGWRTPDDFIRYFPANSIMTALKSATDLRVAILAAATGIYEEILRRKTPALAAEDLRLALEEGTTSSMQVLSVFSAEDRVRYLDPHRIWDFLAEDQFWQAEGDGGEELRRGATERMAFTLTQALTERLITLRDILDGVTYDAVADSLSPHELRAVVRFALLKGRDGIGLSEKVLLEVLPLEKLVRSVPLEHIWREVVIRRLAIPCGFTDLSQEERRASLADKRAPGERRAWPSRPSAPPALPVEFSVPHHFSGPQHDEPTRADHTRGDFARGPAPTDHMVTALPPSPHREMMPEFADEETIGIAANDDLIQASPRPLGMHEGSFLPPPPPPLPAPEPSTGIQQALSLARPSSAPPDIATAEASERQRQRVIEHLRAIGRLPPNHPSLPAAVLRSIDAMYALLPSATDDIQRKSVIRQTFANENHLRAALLGLIELMDSSVDTSDPVIQGAKIEALIKILLFEEQRRKETGRFPSGVQGPRSSMAGPGGLPPSSQEAYSRPAGDGYYYPGPSSAPPSAPVRVATQRPPPPMLGVTPGYPSSAPPLPNLPAEPLSTRRRTLPPPLPPSYPRG